MICELHAKSNCPLCVGPVQPNPVTGLKPNKTSVIQISTGTENLQTVTIPNVEIKVGTEPPPTLTDPVAISITEAAARYAEAREEVASLTEKVKTLESALEVTRTGLSNARAKAEEARKKMSELL